MLLLRHLPPGAKWLIPATKRTVQANRRVRVLLHLCRIPCPGYVDESVERGS